MNWQARSLTCGSLLLQHSAMSHMTSSMTSEAGEGWEGAPEEGAWWRGTAAARWPRKVARRGTCVASCVRAWMHGTEEAEGGPA